MTDHDKPLLLLDIDGVINALPKRPFPAGYDLLRVAGYPIHLGHDVPEMIAELKKHYQIVWFTLWNDNADRYMVEHLKQQPFGYLQTDWADGYDAAVRKGLHPHAVQELMYAKTPLLGELLPTLDRPFIWIDDMHSDFDAMYLESDGFGTHGEDFLLVTTDETVGLQWDDVMRAIDFADTAKKRITAMESSGTL